ncbi:hypothetical protein ACLMJK_002801 [Lecanora helva]
MNGASLESQMELLTTPLFSKVQEPEGSDGSIYDIEILTQAPGSADDDEMQRLAACTLNIAAPIGKAKIRMVDGKIENLWLKNEASLDRLDKIGLLATLLSYVQKFCAGHEVPHLSSIQKADHPAWLRDFFIVAGFSRCDCLKPEAGGQRYRACLKLSSADPSLLQTPIREQQEVETESHIISDSQKERNSALVGSNSTVITADANTTEPSRTLTNGVNGIKVPSKPIAANTLTKDQALEWLSQNKEILSPTTTAQPTKLNTPKPSAIQSSTVEGMSHAKESSGANKIVKQTGEKRKREESHKDAQDNGVKHRAVQGSRGVKENEDELHIKQGLLEKNSHSKASQEPQSSTAPTPKYSYTLTPQSAKIVRAKEPAVTEDTNLTDALLAQVNRTVPKSASVASPKATKKEPSTSHAPISQVAAPYLRSTPNMPSKSLTCYYWATTGVCKHRDEDCIYAHYETGAIARPPNIYKKSKYGGSWSDPNGINIKGGGGAHDGWDGHAPAGPRSYDSWRPS